MGYSECATMNKSFFNFPPFYFSISLTGPESGSFHRPLVDQGSHKVCFCFIYAKALSGKRIVHFLSADFLPVVKSFLAIQW